MKSKILSILALLCITASSAWGQTNSYAPRGYVDECTGQNGSIRVRGWALDEDNLDEALWIHIYVDETHAKTIKADIPSSQEGILNHYFDTYVEATTGSHYVRVFALNIKTDGSDNVAEHTQLYGMPGGSFDGANQFNGITVSAPYAVTYNANGGSGSVASQDKRTGINLTLASSGFTRTGYTLDGWATSAGGDKAYDLGATYTGDAALSLYAHWTPTYTATFAAGNDNNGWTIDPASGVEGTNVTVRYSGENKVKSVTVKKIPSPVTLSTSSLSFTADDFSQDITVTRSGDGAITATSSDESVAKVTVSGNVVTVHRARGAEGSATITISVAATGAYTAPADVTCSYTQTNLRTPGNVTASDKGRFLGQFGYLWKSKEDAAYSNEPLHAVVAYVGSCTNYFDKCLCVALEDISASTLTNAAAHTTLGTWAGNHPVNVWGSTFSTDNGVYDYINGGASWHPRTDAIAKGWRLPTVCDLRYLMNSYNSTSLDTPSEIAHNVSCGSFSDLRTAINTACGNTNFQDSSYGTGSRDSANPSTVGTWHYNTSSTFQWADESYTYYYRAVFAY